MKRQRRRLAAAHQGRYSWRLLSPREKRIAISFFWRGVAFAQEAEAQYRRLVEQAVSQP